MAEEKNIHPGRNVIRNENAKPPRVEFYDGVDGPFHIEANEIPSDMEYRWARAEIEGREDSDNIDTALMEGWQPVPAERHSRLTLSLNKNAVKPDFIRRRGHILMERPKHIGEQFRERMTQQTNAQVNSVNWAVDGGVDKSTLVEDTNQVTRTFQK
jgi:hypothetical protein